MDVCIEIIGKWVCFLVCFEIVGKKKLVTIKTKRTKRTTIVDIVCVCVLHRSAFIEIQDFFRVLLCVCVIINVCCVHDVWRTHVFLLSLIELFLFIRTVFPSFSFLCVCYFHNGALLLLYINSVFAMFN